MKKVLWVLVLLVLAGLTGCSKPAGSDKSAGPAFRLGFMPKLTGIPYFNACKKGAEEAARELGIELTYQGPNQADANAQNGLLDQWVSANKFDAIAVACNDHDLNADSLRDAREHNILVVTYDADTHEDARSFFVNQGTYDDIARAMVDALAGELGPKKAGKVAILTSSIQAPNQSQWARRIKEYVQSNYPDITLLPETEHGEDRDLGITKAKALIQAHPDLKGIIGLTSVAVPAAAEAVRQEGKKGQIKIGGVSTPKDMRDYVQDGTVESFILWNPVDLGYLTVHVAHLLHKNQMPENGTIEAGRLGKITVRNREVLLGKPIRFTKDNIDKYDF